MLGPETLEEFLFKTKRIERVPSLGLCWEWTGARKQSQTPGVSGYGVVKRNGKFLLVHRLVYDLVKPWGLRPSSATTSTTPFRQARIVRHRCDNPCCIRPDHLWSGTQTDNMRDMNARGRHGQLNKPGRPIKLTTEKVVAIRAAHASGESQRSIALRLGVSQPAISGIIAGRTWRHVP